MTRALSSLALKNSRYRNAAFFVLRINLEIDLDICEQILYPAWHSVQLKMKLHLAVKWPKACLLDIGHIGFLIRREGRENFPSSFTLTAIRVGSVIPFFLLFFNFSVQICFFNFQFLKKITQLLTGNEYQKPRHGARFNPFDRDLPRFKNRSELESWLGH